MTEEMFKKLTEAKTAEELIAIAKEYGKELTKEQADEMLKPADADGELSDDDLDSVAGGINMPGWAAKYRPDALKLLKFLF